METELISVIVPVYNVERYLRRCVDSILHQTYRNLEVLLVDDGSTDASGAICDEYAAQEERVTAVHQKNGGLSAARNAGLERAQGTYLCFVDSDDFLDSRMLETLCRDLQEKDADVAVVGFRMFEREEELAPAELAVPVQCMTGREAIRNTLVSDELGDFAWNKLYKRELFRDIRYPLGRMMEDQGTTYRIFQQCSKVVYRPVPLYYYYQRPDSILHRRNMKFYEDKLDMGYQKYQAIREAYPGMSENDAAMLSVVEHCYPYLMQDKVLGPLGMKQTSDPDSPAIPEPVLHAYISVRAGERFYEDATLWDPSWTITRGAIQVTDLYDLHKSAIAFGSGMLLSPESHAAQVSTALRGTSKPVPGCPTCIPQTERFSYGLGVNTTGNWVLQSPAFNGYSAIAAYHAGSKVAIALVVTYAPQTWDDKGNFLGYQHERLFTAIATAILPQDPPPMGT